MEIGIIPSRQENKELFGLFFYNNLWGDQDGKCPVCDQPLTPETGWQIHHRHWRVYGGSDSWDNLVLVHLHCHQQIHYGKVVVDSAASREGRS
jgi:RNA-directed DNA polymerase